MVLDDRAAPATGPAKPFHDGRVRFALTGSLVGGLLIGTMVASALAAGDRHDVNVTERVQATVSQVSSSGRGICVVRDDTAQGEQLCGAPWLWLAADPPKVGDRVEVLVESTGRPATPGSDTILVLLPARG
ncbi:hypothetical protein N865_16040 [Intrasporangium oryzae NRRL B-24470]|uniref:Uncharacterized protein n=1 Tax=Intrasporangium oryzae NRRL B-24470 TaxID=1386089 RepID=W9G2M5_9MICO|nr:hypothetical protein [Intrasporangium oryzae]EWT00376.1 hypothetical protein N865_16040 [Intrasporangium oryzae NRRL B-24470]